MNKESSRISSLQISKINNFNNLYAFGIPLSPKKILR